ncbi:hypothetical protein [Vagococcus xieshaowenii]|uniref:Uncharacterized protein n=1 Tax=Vagococcus xieshaowenii TaxID=2562451 RepID=A0AAJ5EFZ3_9ENTE|nr:hypothetical protein [Vagococcus xieshaowenii]QCA28892.1 hypothetical protein E4Z98_06000 [Vagococcus xieshaowenii]TFZ43310.1 hypothetical protein E4031_00370 [Vagococcus xieshaowenii]
MASSEIRGFRRTAQFNLRKWRFYEKNIVAIQSEERLYNYAVCFFQALKRMDREELELLAQRWYLSNEPCLFNYAYGSYMSVKPVDYPTIANKMAIDKELLPSLYGKAESKLGRIMDELASQVEWEHNNSKLDDIEWKVTRYFKDNQERMILEKAFDEIRVRRGGKAEHEFNHWFADNENRTDFINELMKYIREKYSN